jgi:putative DNA primase/helicase
VHPLRDRLNGLAWDNVERLDGWLTDYLGVKKDAYSATVGHKWMIQAVARVMRPGCKADHTLIFEGLQGPGKSTVCETLALDPEWFADGIADLGTKDSAQDLQGKWIVELGELSAVRRGEVERVKAFLTRKSDHYRPSYGRHSQDFPRQCVFAGSTNATAYLTDPTGNRRFWPIKVGLVDHAALRLDVEQLWAEAVAAFRAGERWWLDPTDELAAADEQDRRVIGDPWEDLVIDAAVRIHSGTAFKKLDAKGYIEPEHLPRTVTTNAVLQVLNVPMERRGRGEETRVGQILAAAGWIRHDNRHGVAPRRYYTPLSLPTSEPGK